MSTDSDDPIALKWAARFFFAVGVAAGVFCAYSAIGTLRFISESTLAEGTVVDWTQGQTPAGRSSEPGGVLPHHRNRGPQRTTDSAARRRSASTWGGWKSANISQSAIEPVTRGGCVSPRCRTSDSPSSCPASSRLSLL